ncbi:hypothetical protein M8756_05945 [Lutimaribacter sp. EGI FJ00015]|uniref:Uncharacterized protein n=1 Tax=Lutimaribacter degradans TaxID=2945989 RepID=A0ACC5ZTF0_9RHOB|nr:hypothetical protein [Lutimaribacter sp. EGI FJ00013]MCM2561448.1 hypothetical protein [Lutimaribacter sp. EGI FJ00013]MCO0612842.1 hypothetical protein [Lutimaribacter sp. EGI FJ00015]MCO0635500.1 hypothetical protein [Lutimaribacter sp. EGI FJ00014]
MTALKQYQRLEATGLWRESPEAQRREVVVSIGDATLVIADMQDRPLTHWSLAAIERANPGESPALFHPDGDPGELLELAPDAEEMIKAIEKLRSAIDRGRPHPGRLRLLMFGLSAAAVAGLALFWLPEVLREHAVKVVPAAKRDDIGAALMTQLQRVTGPACTEPQGLAALGRLAARLPGPDGARPRLHVVRDGVRDALALPGGRILLRARLIEDHEEPDVVAGYIIAAQERAALSDPLDRLLRETGVRASFRLLTTGAVPDTILQRHSETLPAATPVPVPDDRLLAAFADAGVRSGPYAYARDVTGETVLGLIEADPFASGPPPPAVLSDNDWLRLQAICGN